MKLIKLKILLLIAILALARPAIADLSPDNAQKIQEAIEHCEAVDNELANKEYWGGFIQPENAQSVCMAEKFSDLVASEGNSWLDEQAITIINDCSTSAEDKDAYYACVKVPLEDKAKAIAEPCMELGSEQLWEEDHCARLVTYIFFKKFEEIHSDYIRNEVQSEPSDEFELSLTVKWLVEQSFAKCEATNNHLYYKKYWQDSVKPENANTVCIAEQFAIQVAAQGDDWLKQNSEKLIKECEKRGKNSPTSYFQCLKGALEKTSSALSVPCNELGEKGLWSQEFCHRLVTYIFMDKFEQIYESRKTGLDRFNYALGRMSNNFYVKIFINPIIAILFFILFVLDVVFLIEKGTWMQISKVGIFIGPIILFACFTQGQTRFLFSIGSMALTLFAIAYNHMPKLAEKEKKKGPIEIEF